MRSLSVVAVLLALMACGPTLLNPNCNDGPFDPTGTGGFGGFGGAGGFGGSGGFGGGVGTAEPLRVAGRSVSVLLQLNALPRCLSTVSSLEADVFDADGAPVAHTATLASAVGLAPSATITFLPSLPGRYYLRARFEPNLGVVQRFVDITESVDAVALDELPSGDCERVEVLPSKAVLCATKTELVVRRARAEVQRLRVAVNRWVIAGRAVWIDDGVAVRRLWDTGIGPLAESAARGATTAFADARFGTEDTLLSFSISGSSPQLLRQAMVGDALVLTAFEVPYGQAGGGTIRGGMLVSPDLVALAGTDQQVCLVRLPSVSPYLTQPVRCDRTSGSLVGTASERFWLQSFVDSSIFALRSEISGTTSESFQRVDIAIPPQNTGGEASWLPAYRLGDLNRLMLPRLAPSVQAVLVNFPESIDGPYVAREGAIATRSSDQQRWLFFSW